MAEAIGTAIIAAVFESAAVATAVSTTTVVGSLTVAGVVGSTALLAGGVGINLLASSLQGDTRQKVQAQQFSTKQSMPARRRVYGTWKLGGPYVCYDTANGRVFTAIYLCEGPINRFLQINCDDAITALAAQEDVSGPAGVAPWLAAVEIDARHGGTGASQYAALLSPLSYWTPDHRLDGCAYVAMRATAPAEKQFRKVFPSGSFPAVRATIEGSKVRNVLVPEQTEDPSTWTWADAASLCARDLITHPQWGMGVPDSLMDEASWKDAATLDYQTITEKDGTQFPRYFVGGSYELTEDPADVLQSILDARDGELYLTPEGKIGITGGRYVAPDVTIRQEHIVSIASIERGSGKRAAFNRLNISYVSRIHDFQQVEGAPWIDEAAIEAAGETLEADFSRPWVPRHHQLRRLAKIYMARKNPMWRITGLVTNRGGFPALFEDAVLLNLPRYGIVDVPFRIERRVLSADQTACTFDLVSIDPASYAFDTATEQGIDPPAPGVSAVVTPDPPENLVALVERRGVSGDTSAVFLRLLAAVPEREDLSLIGRYRRVGDTAWLDMAAEGDNRGSLISSVLADGESYEVEGAIAGYGRTNPSAWMPAAGSPITAEADPVAPGAPIGFSATGGSGKADLAWTNDGSANVRSARVHRNGTLIATLASGPNQALTYSDTRPAGSYSYTVTNANGSGVEGPAAGPITATVT